MSAPGFRINHEVVDTPPRPAATVLLLREAPEGLEVLMQRRHEDSDVLGGAYVFPGGKVDREDGDEDILARTDVAADVLHAALGDPALDARAAAACYVAAARETFEEAGVLLASRADGRPVDGASAAEAMCLAREGRAFIETLEALDLTLTLSGLLAWSRWVTPRMPSLQRKRFDSRFFLARLPEGQVAVHDNHEATDSLWVSPKRALALYRAREIMLAPPQLMSLIELAAQPGVEQALRPGSRMWPRRVDPHPFEHEGARAVAYPGDPLHADSRRAMPGPTRLVFRQGRFEPFEGVDGLPGAA